MVVSGILENASRSIICGAASIELRTVGPTDMKHPWVAPARSNECT
jgi:hypothetical protein